MIEGIVGGGTTIGISVGDSEGIWDGIFLCKDVVGCHACGIIGITNGTVVGGDIGVEG